VGAAAAAEARGRVVPANLHLKLARVRAEVRVASTGRFLAWQGLRAAPLEVGKQITAVAFDTQPDGTIEDSEARLIIAELVSWIMEAPEKQKPEPADVVRRSIELMIARATLTEVGDTIRKEKDQVRRQEAESEIRRAAQVKASKVNLNSVKASSADITKAIEDGVKQLAEIYGEKK